MSVPSGTGVDVNTGVEVKVGVALSTGVDVNVGVSDGTGVKDAVGVAVSTGVKDVGVGELIGVEVGVAVSTGVREVGVAVSTGVKDVGVGEAPGVSEATGVGVNVAVGRLPMTVTEPPLEGIWVRTLLPVETRTVQSIEDCPACNPFTLNVNAVPSVVALFPLLPAIATMNVPFCGPLIATAGSAPKREVTAMLLTSTRLAL